MQYVALASAVLSVVGQLQGGKQAQADADYQAAQLEQNAGQQRAAAQREAAEQRRQARLATSRAQAVAGGGGGDPSVVRTIADISGEGEYRALTSIYEGEERARGMEDSAKAKRAMGKQSGIASMFGVASTIFDKGPSLYEKYGKGGPTSSGDGLSQGDRRKIGVY